MRLCLASLSVMVTLVLYAVFAAAADAPKPDQAAKDRFAITAVGGKVEVRTMSIRALCRRTKMLTDGRTLLLEAGDGESIEFWGLDNYGDKSPKRLARSIKIEFSDGSDGGKYVVDLIEKGEQSVPPNPPRPSGPPNQ